ncbi:MAG: LacI family DNA-binding transcriptional regulator [Acidobacteriota bacterium]
MKPKSSSPIGIKAIAEALKVSIGTVDRALHGRPGVSPKTLAVVLKMAEKLNYRPNIAARSLKLNRTLRIAVHLPEQIASFFDLLREGVRAAAAANLGVRVDLDFRSYPRMGEGDVELLRQDADRAYDGIILTVGDPKRIDPVLRQLQSRNVPVVCVVSDAPHGPRLASVSVDTFVSGSIAAELLAMALTHKGTVAAVTGSLNTLDHGEKLRGFAATLAVMAPRIQMLAAVESHDRPEDAYRKTLTLLKNNPRLGGLYVNTANSLPVLRALEEKNLLGRVQVVTTDLFPELIPLIDSGNVLATLHQRPFTQGKIAFETLLQYLLDRSLPKPITRLAPHIILRSNLSLFSSQM